STRAAAARDRTHRHRRNGSHGIAAGAGVERRAARRAGDCGTVIVVQAFRPASVGVVPPRRTPMTARAFAYIAIAATMLAGSAAAQQPLPEPDLILTQRAPTAGQPPTQAPRGNQPQAPQPVPL